MSYCRWSSDNFRCDVYVYGDVSGGYTTHVAARRHRGRVPKVPVADFDTTSPEEWLEAHRRQMKWLGTARYKSIGLPEDGNSFSDATPGECADRLEHLRSLGYHVPDYAIQSLREESKEAPVEHTT